MRSYGLTYKNVVVDCDPGTEIFPRKILDQIANNPGIDYLLTVLDGSRMSLDTAKEIKDEVNRRKLKVKNISAVCTRVDDAEVQNEIRETARNNYGIEVIAFIPIDTEIVKASLTNQSILNMPDSPAYKATRTLLNALQFL